MDEAKQLNEIKGILGILTKDVEEIRSLLTPRPIPGGPKGALDRIAAMEAILHGQDQDHWGLLTQHRMMWRSWIWIMCSGSAALGAMLAAAAKWLIW